MADAPEDSLRLVGSRFSHRAPVVGEIRPVVRDSLLVGRSGEVPGDHVPPLTGRRCARLDLTDEPVRLVGLGGTDLEKAPEAAGSFDRRDQVTASDVRGGAVVPSASRKGQFATAGSSRKVEVHLPPTAVCLGLRAVRAGCP